LEEGEREGERALERDRVRERGEKILIKKFD
jgi:hypothetical protein